MRFRPAVLALAVTLAIVLPTAARADDGPGRQYDHIFVIVEENTEFTGIINNPKAPTINRLAGTSGLATQYFGVIHPSEGNYVALVGGDAYDIRDDAPYTTHTIDKPSIVEQLEAARLTWKGYFQNLPLPGYAGTCYPTVGPCLYASKHNGFLNFAHVQTSDAEKAKLVPDTNLAADLADGTVPNLAFIVPDQCHDLHGIGGTCTGDELFAETDQYLSSTVDEIVHSDLWTSGRSALVVTFDEGDSTLGCCDANPGGGRIVTVVVRNEDGRPLEDPTPYNHYSLVATLQAAFGLGCQFNGTPVGLTCDTANGVQPMAPLFGLR